MARSDDYHARDSPLPSAQRLKPADSGSSTQVKHNVNSSYLKTQSPRSQSGSPRKDTRVLVHSPGRFRNPRDSFPSINVSRDSSSPGKTEQDNTLGSRNVQDCFVGETPPKSASRQLIDISTSNTSSDETGGSSQRSRGASKPNHLMPLKGGLSRDESPSASVEFSRTSFEHQGLGIYSNCERAERQNDPLTSITTRKDFPGLHHRSTSGTSQLSTASSSSVSKPGSQYIHPMRQAPRAYTPPLSQSYQTSIFESDGSGKGDFVEGDCLAQSGSDALYPSMRASSAQTPRLSLQIHDHSFTRLPGVSQTNITSRSSFGYSRDNGSTLDTASPISRSSLDFVFRSKTRNSMDPVSRAATVQAARQAFEEKEAAKARKFEEQQMKAEEKQMRRKDKQHWRTSLRDDDAQEPACQKETSEKPKAHAPPEPPQPASQPESTRGSWKPQSKNTWMHFLTWLRTRIFKLRRKIRTLG